MKRRKPKVDRPKPTRVSDTLLMDNDEYRELYLKYIGTLGVLAQVANPVGGLRESMDICMKDARTFLAKRLKFTHKRGRWSIDTYSLRPRF